MFSSRDAIPEDRNEDSDGNADGDTPFNSGAISLQKLLSSNVITNENGVIYLDMSSAQSLLASFGMGKADADDADDALEQGQKLGDDDKVEEL